jgi:hypothetical protein
VPGAAGVRYSPFASVVYVPLRTVVPSPVGGHDSIHQDPVWAASAKKKWRWNVQTWGSFRTIGSVSVPPSWILTVPLFPGAPVGDAPTVGPAIAKATRATTTPQPSNDSSRGRRFRGDGGAVVRFGSVVELGIV